MRLGSSAAAQGFTLIELMIGIVIFTLLMLLAAPMYGDFMGNTQVRTATESVLTGVRLAQSEAVRRGIPVRFEMPSATSWRVVFLADDLMMKDCGATPNCISDNRIAGTCNPGDQCVVRSYDFVSNGGAPYVQAGTLNGTIVTFNSLGIPIANPDGSNSLTRIDLQNTNYTSARHLSVIVGIGTLTSASNGGTRVCDDTLPATDPMGCPPES